MDVTWCIISAPVGHADEQDVVQGIHAVDLGEQLVDHSVMHAAAAGHAAALLADGIDLIKDDDVQLGAVAPLRLLCLRILQAHRCTGVSLLSNKDCTWHVSQGGVDKRLKGVSFSSLPCHSKLHQTAQRHGHRKFLVWNHMIGIIEIAWTL